jgi:diguanylate cyclase (GGDEF)-like protein
MINTNIPTKLTAEVMAVLETAPLFMGVSRELLENALSTSTVISLPKGGSLLVPEQINQYIYIVLSGRLSVKLDELSSHIIAMFGQGECVGEMSMLSDGTHSGLVVAATDCKLLVIKHAALWLLIDASHEAAHNMLSILSQRIRIRDRLIEENVEQNHGYQGLVIVDELTGLYDRNWMFKEIGRYLQRCIRDNKLSCLFMLEMDGYQKYVDTYGVLGGDQALRAIASTILSCMRPEDQVGRHIGPQFTIHLPNAMSLEIAYIAAERLRTAISEAKIALPTGDVLPQITISLGVSQSLDDGVPGLFTRAENALQDAQSKGGNCVSIYSNIGSSSVITQ